MDRILSYWNSKIALFGSNSINCLLMIHSMMNFLQMLRNFSKIIKFASLVISICFCLYFIICKIWWKIAVPLFFTYDKTINRKYLKLRITLYLILKIIHVCNKFQPFENKVLVEQDIYLFATVKYLFTCTSFIAKSK